MSIRDLLVQAGILALLVVAIVLLGGKIRRVLNGRRRGRTKELTPTRRPAAAITLRRPVPPVKPMFLPPPTLPASIRGGRPNGGDDLLAIVGFNHTSSIILPPTRISEPGVRRRIDEISRPERFRGGNTNLAAGIAQALTFLERSHNRVRRLVVVSDGEPNMEVERLSGLAEQARRSHVSICTIFTGMGNSPVLQSMADKTVGGWHTSVSKMNDLADAVRRASAGAVGQRRSGRSGIVVIAIDLSTSMGSPLPNEPMRRIDAAVRAVHAMLDWHAAMYGQKVAA